MLQQQVHHYYFLNSVAKPYINLVKIQRLQSPFLPLLLLLSQVLTLRSLLGIMDLINRGIYRGLLLQHQLLLQLRNLLIYGLYSLVSWSQLGGRRFSRNYLRICFIRFICLVDIL